MLKLRQHPPYYQQFDMNKSFNNVIIIKCFVATMALIPLVGSTPITAPLPTGIKSAAIDLGPSNGPPCIHGSFHQHQGHPLNSFQAQTEGRILNKQPAIFETSVTSTNGFINTDHHTQALNNIHQKLPSIGVPCFSQQNLNGQNYKQEQIALLSPPLPNSNVPPFDQGYPQPPTQLPAPAFYLGKLGVGKVIPSQVLAGQFQDNDRNRVAGIIPQSSGSRVYQHYASSVRPGSPSVINGFGKAPAPAPAPAPAQSFISSNIGFNPGLQTSIGNGNDVFNPSLQPPFANIPSHSTSLATVQQTAGGFDNNFQNGFNSNAVASTSNSNSFSPNPSILPFGIPVSGPSSHHSSTTGISTHFTSASSDFQNSVGTIDNILGDQLGHVIHEAVASSSLDPSAEKHIYVHVPPDELEERHRETVNFLPPSKPRKHYKIIFIKAPSVAQQASQIQSTSANLIPQTEEKTIIYVLVKKPDEPSLEEIQQIQQKQTVKYNKPEVYFIKYKTRQNEDTNSHIDDSNSNSNNNNGAANSAVGIDIRSGSGESVSSISSSSTFSVSPSSPLDPASSSVSSSPSKHYLPSSTNLSSGDGYVVPHNHKLNGVPLE